jgi:Tfp pilus assembly protein FimT
MAIPAITTMLGEMRVGASAREVERELQTARLRAVSTNRPMRVRFNCPTAGQFRLVELIGTPTAPATDDSDSRAAARCSTAKYPYPDRNRGVFDIPNNDGDLKQLNSAVQFVAVQTIEFWPDGTARTFQGRLPWDPIPTNAPISITLQKASGSAAAQLASRKSIQVNGLGKVQLQ